MLSCWTSRVLLTISLSKINHNYNCSFLIVKDSYYQIAYPHFSTTCKHPVLNKRQPSTDPVSSKTTAYLVEAQISFFLGVLPLWAGLLRGRLEAVEALVDQRVGPAVRGDADHQLPSLGSQLQVEANGIVLRDESSGVGKRVTERWRSQTVES